MRNSKKKDEKMRKDMKLVGKQQIEITRSKEGYPPVFL